MLTGLVFGLAPAWRAGRLDPARAIGRLRGAVTTPLRPGRLLSIVQLALSLVLLVAAGLFVRSLGAQSGPDEDGIREHVLTLRVEPRGSDQRGVAGTSERLDRLYLDLLRRIRTIPGVVEASLANSLPTSPRSGMRNTVRTPSGEEIRVAVLTAYPAYFATIGVPIVRGRDFNTADLPALAPLVCIVNESYVSRVYPGVDPIGKPCQRDLRPRLASLGTAGAAARREEPVLDRRRRPGRSAAQPDVGRPPAHLLDVPADQYRARPDGPARA